MSTEAEAAAKAEIARKLSSQAWRLSNLYWVQDESGKKVKWSPRWEQRELHNNLHSLNVVLKCRQPGISTYCAIRALDLSLFSPDKTTVVIDKTDKDAVRKLDKVKFAYEHLDDADDPATTQIGALIKATNPLITNNDHELEWKNGSKMWAGTNMRGGTLQFLWITELGYISFYDPKSAEEIRKGALNTIHKGNLVIIESTHEGGKFGVFYALVKLAMESVVPLSEMDWKFHFFPWWRHRQYRLAIDHGFKPSKEEEDYFAKLVEQGISLTDEQKYWYIKKKDAIGDAIMSEFPSVESECFEAVIKGAIYGANMTQLRAKKRIVDFEADQNSPFFTFWDLGWSDFMAIWLLQFVGREIHALHYRCNCRQVPSYYVGIIREWERVYEMQIQTNFLPHDADKKELTGKSFRDYLRELGIANTQVVIRTPDEWLGIIRLRSLLPRFYFHKTNCGKEWKRDGQDMPSGIGCLEGYHTKEDGSTGVIKETPVHDENSHGCDALRTFSEAEMRGLLPGSSDVALESQRGPRKVIMAGWNAPRDEHRPRPRTIMS